MKVSKQLMPIFFLVLFSCTEQEEKQSIIETKKPVVDNTLTNKLKYLKKLGLCGDFNGDGKQDTLFQDNVNSITGVSIDSFPNPCEHEWDSIVFYFGRNHSDIVLYSSMPKVKPLHLGEGMGLYCLINLGDTNRDHKDEIALVTDETDYSRVNSCSIFTVCDNEWFELKTFAIHEDAFDYYDQKPPRTDQITGFLEKEKGEWKYLDYHDFEIDSEEEIRKPEKLNLKSCK